MSFGQIIKGTRLPKIPLKELSAADSSVNSKNILNQPSNLPDSSQSVGSTSPFVQINDRIVSNIQTMIIDETSFIPTISLTFTDSTGEFAGDNFPKTDLVMSLYIKVGNKKLKPIRIDFLITGVKAIPKTNIGEPLLIGMGTTYIIKGEMFIPDVYRNISRSYSTLNSKQALQKISEDLGLGFAENESAPNDKMTWINTSMSTLDFMQEIAKHAYQDDDSFFSVFIDKYYYLNYIEVNRQLRIGYLQNTFITPQNSLILDLMQTMKDDPEIEQIENTTTVNYLTTQLEYRGKSNYITQLSLLSDHGSIVKSKGYKRNIFYYDHLKGGAKPAEKFTDFFMTPLKSIDRESSQFLIPEETSLAENSIKKWMNIEYGNTHSEWNAARLLNSHNLKELDKLKLKVTLDKINFQVARGFTIPVVVTVLQAEKLLKSFDPESEEDSLNTTPLDSEVPDPQLTGYYYVSGAKYYYDISGPTGFYTELFLSRREWLPSKNNTN